MFHKITDNPNQFYKITDTTNHKNYYLYKFIDPNYDKDEDFHELTTKLLHKHLSKVNNKKWDTWVIIDDILCDLHENHNYIIIEDTLLPSNIIEYDNEIINNTLHQIQENKTKKEGGKEIK